MQNQNPIRKLLHEAVVKKYADSKNHDFTTKETDKLYEKFTSQLVKHFKELLSNKELEELSNVINKTKDQKTVLSFLMIKVNNFELELLKYVSNFKKEYLKG